jgi:hypothetical protein
MKAFAMRQADIVGGDVVLEIDKALALGPDLEHRGRIGIAGHGFDGRQHGRRALPAAAQGRRRGLRRLPRPYEKLPVKAPAPIHCCVGFGGRKACRAAFHSALAPAWLARWMVGDQPPDISRQSAWMLRASPMSAPVGHVEMLHVDAGQRLAAFGGDDGMASEIRLRPPRPACASRPKVQPYVGDGDDRCTRLLQGDGRAIGAVIVGEQRDPLAGSTPNSLA